MGLQKTDVSEYDGRINWEQEKEAGRSYVVLCAGGGAGDIDVQFRRNAEECKKVGIPFGVSWMSYAYTPEMAEKEAEYCAETIEEYDISGFVRFDYDKGSVRYARSKGVTITGELVGKLADAFCRRMKELGYSSAMRMELNIS